MINNLVIHGFRGYGRKVELGFAIPNGNAGSGLTFIVGSNNTGKTSILEALRCFNNDSGNPPTFSEHKRNIKCDKGRVCLKLSVYGGYCYEIKTSDNGGSTANYSRSDKATYFEGQNTYFLQSRRSFFYEFGKSNMERKDYIRNYLSYSSSRKVALNEFNARLFKMYSSKTEFDMILKKVLGYDLDWMIEQNDNEQYYLKLIVNGMVHTSEGLGDGIWSLFTICDALYDSTPGSIVAIDEPELSLHPAYQKRIMNLFMEYAKDRQIIISTHSPYFIDFTSITNGAELIRTVKNKEGDIEVYSLKDEHRKIIRSYLDNINNPHIIGMEAKEIFFLEDNIVLTEGQEDVIFYQKALLDNKIGFNGNFFGWGAGGASEIKKLAKILEGLGYKKVVAIYDGDMSKEKERFASEFPSYNCHIISADDVRDKPAREAVKNKIGLMTSNGELKPEHKEELSRIFDEIKKYFNG